MRAGRLCAGLAHLAVGGHPGPSGRVAPYGRREPGPRSAAAGGGAGGVAGGVGEGPRPSRRGRPAGGGRVPLRKGPGPPGSGRAPPPRRVARVPEPAGRVALLLLIDARRETRTTEGGHPV